MLSVPIADELIKIKWKRRNLPPKRYPRSSGGGEEMLLAGFALPCPSDQTWMFHRNVSSLCNLHKFHHCAPLDYLCPSCHLELWKWCQEKQLEARFLIKEPLSPSLVTPRGHSQCFALFKLFRTVIAALDMRLDKHTRKTQNFLGFEEYLQPSPEFGQMLIGTGTLMSTESHPCPWEETGACRKTSQE